MINNSIFSGINIIGLAIGIASFFVLFIHVANEKSFDKHFEDHENIYRVISSPVGNSTPWARSLGFINNTSSTLPEVLEATQFSYCSMGTIKINENSLQQEDIMSVDESFINMFEVESLIGNLDEISEPNTAFISEELAKKYFKGDNPIGKTIRIEALQYFRDVGDYEIRGVVKNTHPKTHFSYHILLSQKGALQQRYEELPNRKIHWVYNYYKLKDGVSPSSVAEKLFSVYEGSSLKQARGPQGYEFGLVSLSDIHLESDYMFELRENSSKMNMGLFMLISFVILVVSLMNFINLNIAKLINRLKEFGLQRALGVTKRQLIVQVLVDTLIHILIAMFISIVTLEILSPFINQFFDIEFKIYYSEPLVYIVMIGVLVLCGAMSTLFLAYFLFRKTSSIQLLSGKSNKSGNLLLKSLLILQLFVVIVLISSTLIVNEQISFITNKSLGFKQENVLVIHMKDFSKDPEVFANQLRKQSSIKAVGFTSQHFGYPAQQFGLEDFGIDGQAEFVFANYDYIKTMDIQLIHNWIVPSADTIEGMLINEHLYKRFMEKHGSMEALKAYYYQQELEEGGLRIEIIGVMKDFNYNSAHDAVGDFAFYLGESRNRARFIHVRINPDDTRNAIREIQKVWDEQYMGQELNYFFLDEKIANQYKAEVTLEKVLFVFSLLSILISIIGISAMSLFISQKRTKEIGIRKVNGASFFEILIMLLLDVVKWVSIAFVIAVPVAYLFMSKWLENFAYKSPISWWIFLLSGLMALTIAILTVSWQTFKSANRNPVEALRYE
jgi:putative ABC transport system permease protein